MPLSFLAAAALFSELGPSRLLRIHLWLDRQVVLQIGPMVIMCLISRPPFIVLPCALSVMEVRVSTVVGSLLILILDLDNVRVRELGWMLLLLLKLRAHGLMRHLKPW